MSNPQSDVSVNLIRSLIENISGPDADLGNWESMTIIIDSYEGTFNGASGYLYSPDGTISAVAASPWKVLPAINAYADSYYQPGETLPVKILVQFHRPSGNYKITFEDTDETRWKVSPRTIKTIRQDLRPTLDETGELKDARV